MAGKSTVEPFVGIGCQELMADGCSHSGIVQKEMTSLRFATYNLQRYLVLKSGCLYCFGGHNDAKATEQFSLAGYRLSSAPEKKGHAFKLIDRDPKKKSLVFTVASAREKDEWMTKIQEDFLEYCRAEEPYLYEEAEPMEGDHLYLDPMSRPALPLPDERSRKSQSLYIPRKTKTFSSEQTSQIPKLSPPAEVAKEWPPLPPLPHQIRAGDKPELPPTPQRQIPAKSVPKLAPQPAPKPAPRLQPKPKPKPRNQSFDNTRRLPPRPSEQHPPTPVRRYQSDSQLDPKSLAGVVVQEFKDAIKNLGPTPVEDLRTDNQQLPPRSGPGNRYVKRIGPDGDSFRRKDQARAVEPSFSNILTEDLSSVAPKKMDMLTAARFLTGRSKPGSFVLRDSGSSESGKAISVWIEDKVKHYRVFYQQETGYALSHSGPEFGTIKEVIKYYRYNTLPNT